MGELVETTFGKKQRDAEKLQEENEKTMTGEVKCLACQHEWVAVAPLSTMDCLECPSCSLMRGSFRWPPQPEKGAVTFVCTCGCELFYLSASRAVGDGQCFKLNSYGTSPEEFRQICAGCGKISNPFMEE